MEKVFQVGEIMVTYLPAKLPQTLPEVKTADQAFDVISRYFIAETIQLQEQFVVMYLNQGNRVLGAYRCSIGGITGTVADIRLILGVGLKMAATGLIIAHNHPSGSLLPSLQDKQLTDKLKKSCQLMDLKLVDHLILSSGTGYFSFTDEGLI